MAFTRNTTSNGGLLGTIIKQADGKFDLVYGDINDGSIKYEKENGEVNKED